MGFYTDLNEITIGKCCDNLDSAKKKSMIKDVIILYYSVGDS